MRALFSRWSNGLVAQSYNSSCSILNHPRTNSSMKCRERGPSIKFSKIPILPSNVCESAIDITQSRSCSSRRCSARHQVASSVNPSWKYFEGYSPKNWRIGSTSPTLVLSSIADGPDHGYAGATWATASMRRSIDNRIIPGA